MFTFDREGKGRLGQVIRVRTSCRRRVTEHPGTQCSVRKPTVENNIGRRRNNDCLGTFVDFIPKAKRNKLT